MADDLKRSNGLRSSVHQQFRSGAMFPRPCDSWATGLRSGLDHLGGADVNRVSALGMFLIFSVASGWNAAFAADSSDADRQAITKLENEWSQHVQNSRQGSSRENPGGRFRVHRRERRIHQGSIAYIDGLLQGEKLADFTLSEVLSRCMVGPRSLPASSGAKDAKGAIESTRFTDTFVKGDDGWKAVSSQDTKIK